MKLLFNEAKATQAATQFLRLRGGRISYIKLIKLLYLADREALIRWGRPITTDCYVSMDVGPVVSRIYDLIRNEPSPNSVKIWSKFISDPEDYEVRLLGDPGSGELSPAEEKLIDEVFRLHGQDSRWAIVDYTYSLPEWTHPDGPSWTTPTVFPNGPIRMEARCQSSTAISSELPARPRRKSPPQKKSLSLWPFSNASSRSNAVRRYAAGA